MSGDRDQEINLLKGSCTKCGATVYGDNPEFIVYKDALYCSKECAEKATGDEIKIGLSKGDKGYECPYCGELNGVNEGSSVTLENDTIIFSCAYCNKESISNEKANLQKERYQYQIVIEGSDPQEVRKLFEEIQNKYSLYDNCVFQQANIRETIVDANRTEETGNLSWNPSGTEEDTI